MDEPHSFGARNGMDALGVQGNQIRRYIHSFDDACVSASHCIIIRLTCAADGALTLPMNDCPNSTFQCPSPPFPSHRCGVRNVHGAVGIQPRRARVTFRMSIRQEPAQMFQEGGPLSQRKTCAGVGSPVKVAKMDVSGSVPTVVGELVLEISYAASNILPVVVLFCFDLDSVLICNILSFRLGLLACNPLNNISVDFPFALFAFTSTWSWRSSCNCAGIIPT